MTTNITGLNKQAPTYATSQTKPPKGEGKPEGQGRGPAPAEKNQDTYTPSEGALAAMAATEEESTTVEVAEEAAEETTTSVGEESTSYSVDKEAVMKLKADFAQQQQDFYNSMMSTITGQANASLNASSIWDKIQSDLNVTPEMQASAQASIEEGGFWSPEETASRIFSMAQALSGGDPAKADELMAAIEKGYEAAEKAWGGELPSITADTKTLIDEKFAEWTSSIS